MDGIGLITVILTILSSNAYAVEQPNDNVSAPTVVYGAAATPDGKDNVFIVEQPKDAPNPLGDPIPYDQPTEVYHPIYQLPSSNTEAASQPSVAPFATENNGDMPAEDKALGKDFQNTLMEANGMVYDIQAYPKQDLQLMGNPSEPQTIYSPNVNN